MTGELYTGTVGGQIVKLTGSDPVVVANITGVECQYSGLFDQRKCGRPLGLRFDSKGSLYVVDAFLGIKKVDVKTGKVETVFDPRGVVVDGQEILFLDDIALDEGAGSKGGHVFYATDVSGKYDLDVCFLVMMSGDKSGRVIRYDADSGKVSVVASGIKFPNGIELTDDRESVIVSEIAARKLLKIAVKGKDAGKVTAINPNLPCMVDNVRRSARQDQETYWLACFGAHKEKDLFDEMRKYPFLSKAFVRFNYNLGALILKIGQTVGCNPMAEFGYHVRGGELVLLADPVKKAGMVLEADKNGKILKSLQDPDGKVSLFSEVHEIRQNGKRDLYLASFVNPYVVKVTIDDESATPVKARAAAPKPDVKPAAPPTKTTAAPTTTTSTTTKKPAKSATAEKTKNNKKPSKEAKGPESKKQKPKQEL
jgi:sugar lactone lactonase YvrE